jgi:hyperosmotically inducible protein
MTGRISKIAVGLLTVMALVACASTRTQKTAGEQLDDSVITSRVKTALTKDLGRDALKIDVETFRQRVQLNGFIDKTETKREATRIAQNVKGVSQVENNLKLSTEERTAGRYIDDKMLVAKIKTALAEDPVVKAHEVNVEVREGVAQLAGFVDTSEQKSRAAEVTSNIDGVKSVDNQLDVKRR